MQSSVSPKGDLGISYLHYLVNYMLISSSHLVKLISCGSGQGEAHKLICSSGCSCICKILCYILTFSKN